MNASVTFALTAGFDRSTGASGSRPVTVDARLISASVSFSLGGAHVLTIWRSVVSG
jgi:hypothetical protein